MKAIAFALPVLLTIMYVEYYFSKRKGRNYFNFSDSISNLSIGILDRLTSLLFAGFFYFVYDSIQTKYGVFDIKPILLHWVMLFFIVDFLWYWYHRFSHEVNLFWTAHVVHHQSEQYNYTVGTRITVFQSFVRLLFWCILPLVGFPAPMIITLLLIHGLYSFFTHTRLIGKLGFLEKILVTPSHHRVHHASNGHYLDKNYGGVFIIWDKLFGTFAEEKSELQFGLTKPLESRSLLWQLFHFWVELYYDVKEKKGLWNKIKLLFGKPDDVNPTLRNKLERIFLSTRRRGKLSLAFKYYIITQIAISITALIGLLYFSEVVSLFYLITISAFIILTLINCGAILEQKIWVFNLEFVRLSLILLIVGLYNYTGIVIAYLAFGALVVYYPLLKKYYYSFYLVREKPLSPNPFPKGAR